MAKSTWLLAGSCCLLVAAIGAVVRYAWHNPVATGQVRGETNLQIGLGPQKAASGEKNYYSTAILLWDSDAHVIREEVNAFEERPIASITKLMTAMVLLDNDFDWETPINILPEEYVIGGKLMLQPGETATKRDLFYASLLGSANNATLALVRTSGLSEDEFVRQMNRKAIELNLEQTHFVEVTGLDKNNVSTAYDVARLAEWAFHQYPDIAKATSQSEYTFTVGGTGREHTMRNTNKLISKDNQQMKGSKTGYLDEAGYCLVTQGASQNDHLIAVTLGSATEEGSLLDTDRLINNL